MTKINLKTNKTDRQKDRNMVYIGIIHAVDMHHKAMQLVYRIYIHKYIPI